MAKSPTTDEPFERPAEGRAGNRGIPPGLIVGGLLGGAMLLTMIILLALALAELRTARQHIESQDAKATLQLQAVQPALEEVPALVDDAGPLVEEIAGFFEPLTGETGLNSFTAELPELLGGADRLLTAAVPLAQGLAASDLPATVAETRELVALLSASDLPRTVAAANELITVLSGGDRLAATLDSGRRILESVEALGLPRRAARSTRRLKTLLAVQRTALRVLDRSAEIQRKTLKHVRSLDRKTVALEPVG